MSPSVSERSSLQPWAPPPEVYWAAHQNEGEHAAQGAGHGHHVAWWNRLMVQCMPLIPKPLVWPLAQRYVAGESLEHMNQTVTRLNAQGCRTMVNLLGEYAHTTQEAEQTAQTYETILQYLENQKLQANVTIKLTSLGLKVDRDRCFSLTEQVIQEAERRNNFVRVEMEDSSLTEAIIELYLALRQNHSNVGIVTQAYLRRSIPDVRRIIKAGAGHFRLCKGIYREPRWMAYHDPELINRNYARLLEIMLGGGAYVGIATHDERLVWEALNLIDRLGLTPDQYEFQMLMGVDPTLEQMILSSGHPLRVYVPFGPQWHAYSLRRFKENPTIARYVLQQWLHA